MVSRSRFNQAHQSLLFKSVKTVFFLFLKLCQSALTALLLRVSTQYTFCSYSEGGSRVGGGSIAEFFLKERSHYGESKGLCCARNFSLPL